jgi:hypothetical protein
MGDRTRRGNILGLILFFIITAFAIQIASSVFSYPNAELTETAYNCGEDPIIIEGECKDLSNIEDSFLTTWKNLEENNPEGVGFDVLVAETQLENKDQVWQMIEHLRKQGKATCFSENLFVMQCLPVRETEENS